LALTSRTSGGCSVGIFRSWTKATEFFFISPQCNSCFVWRSDTTWSIFWKTSARNNCVYW
jgi:hypothetical protein